MRIYHYTTHGEYVGESEAEKCPLEGRDLIPSQATHIAPPQAGAGEIAVFENGAWHVKTDNRGIWFNELGYQFEITRHDEDVSKLIKQAKPGAGAGEIAIFENGAWHVKKDNRGKYFTHDGNPHEVIACDEDVSALTKVAPPDDVSTWNGAAWVQDAVKVKAKHNAPILAQIAALEAQVTDRVWRETITKLNVKNTKNNQTPAEFIAAIDAQIDALRAGLV